MEELLAGKKILIVDDEPDILETLKEMHRRGARRFGIGLRAAPPIFEQCASQSVRAVDGTGI